jgi:hypothetical protein
MTSQEVAREFARRIRSGARQDVLAEGLSFSAEEVAVSQTWDAVETVRSEVRSLTVGGRRITEEQVRGLLRLTGGELGLEDPDLLVTVDESFSNSSYLQMVATVSSLIKQVKR